MFTNNDSLSSSSHITHGVKIQIESLTTDAECSLRDQLAQKSDSTPQSEINMDPAILQTCLTVCSGSLEDIRSLMTNNHKTLDFASRGDGLSVYTVADQIELLRGSGSDAPVRPGVYQWAEKSKAIRVARREDNPGIARPIIGPHFLDLSARLLLGLQKFQQSCRD